MRADVAFAERAEDRVDERVERDIGIAVAGEPPGVTLSGETSPMGDGIVPSM